MREKKITRKADDREVASRCLVAEGPLERMKGLLGRQSLGQGQGLWIEPCNSVHTFFMKFTIDVVFLNGEGKIVGIYKSLKPWRSHLPVWGARAALELPEGASNDLKVGDILCSS